MVYLIKTPQFIQNLFPSFTWRIPTTEKVLYLTFDDGPIPEVTPWVLDQLNQYGAKATFFCVGENIYKHPDVFERVKEEGHALGNHTYNHLNGWTTDNLPYYHNIRKCARKVDSDLFRPPYGKLKPRQVQFLSRHYRIVMWDILSGDFDPDISADQCFNNVAINAGPGSIVVFHDSIKALSKLKSVLPKTLEHFSKLGYRFEAMVMHTNSKEREALRIA
jgi:peptidoglycan/xylan/chitin deacetylase (PgdA/CDA1 family)